MSLGLLDRLDGQVPALLAEAFARSPVPKAVISLRTGTLGRIVEANAAFGALVGHRREEIVGDSCQTLVAEEDLPGLLADMDLLAGGTTPAAPLERSLLCQDGSRVWVTCHVTVVRDEHGAAYAVGEIVESSRGAPPSSEERLFDASPIGMALIGLDASWRRLNPALTTLLGYAESELAGLDWQALTHPDDAGAGASLMRELRAGQRDGYELRKRLIRKDGQVVWCRLAVALIRDAAGAPEHLLAQFVDVTADRHERELLDVTFDATFEANPTGMAIGDRSGRLLRVNAAYAALVGRRDAVFTFPKDLDTDPHAVRRYEERFVHPEGRVVWGHVCVTSIEGPDGERHLLAQVEDITARKRAEQHAARETARLRTTISMQREITGAAQNRDAVLRLMAQRTLRVLPEGDTCLVQMIDRDAGVLRPVAGTGRLAAHNVPPAPLTGSLAGLAVSSGSTIGCDDTAVDPRSSKAMSRATGTRSLIVAPLRRADGTVFGTLSVGSARPAAFDDGDEQQVTLLAHALAGALQHAGDAARNAELLAGATSAVQALEEQRKTTLATIEQVRRSERRFVSVFGNSPVAMIVVGLHGVDRGRISLANPAFWDLLGYSAERAIGLHLADLTGETTHNLERGLEAIAAGRSRGGQRETVLRRRDGSRGTVSAHTSVIADDDGPASAVIQLLDITAARHTAADLEQLLRERTDTLAALQVSETRFRLTFDNSPLGLSLVSLAPESQGRYLATNPAMTRITGYPAAELAAMTYRDLVHPDDITNLPNAAARSEHRYRHRDGRIVWVAVSTAPVHDDAGKPLYLVSQVEDITARRAAEAELRRQARMLELIPAAVIIRDLDGAIRWWNQAATDLYGWSLDDARGRSAHQLLDTVFPGGTTVDSLGVLVQRHGRWDGQLEHRTATGRRVTVLSRMVLHHTDHDPHILEINADVTAARAAEQARAESEQRFRALFANSAAGQLICTPDGTVIAANAAYARLVGRPAEQLTGRVDTELVDGLSAGEDSYTCERRLQRADDRWIDVEATVSLVRDPDGRPQHIIAVLTDITDRLVAERSRDHAATELADRNDQLEAANQLKLDIMGMLGHEIGNPLSAVRGYAELLDDDWRQLQEGHRSRAISTIHRRAAQLDDILKDVLAMVTIDAGSITTDPHDVSVRDEVDWVLAATGNESVPVSGEGIRAFVDPGHLQQMLTNLLSNAAKFAGGATAIRITADGTRARIEVEDSGPGVPEDFRPRLFDRLSRAQRDAGTTSGTGLGLHIVRRLTHANRAGIRHEPNPAGGARFILELCITAW
ncbi:PAS domain S-box protein [Paractinoplanes rishiriensis]|uniref:histidine kinase n=1 Tax=Paractinoplanes rishiriensis TaxID=1050105 RepID=A0A919MYC4_9ACTN|nr:PAS domain S-box protein [Actinoplanes rishiriensis]GIF00014.1 hypothetical protein Ari01nite_74780 [Actinoplanes rishiriensis]